MTADSPGAYARRRNIVVRPDGRRVNVARPRGQLFVCATGCCCGRTEDGFAPVPAETLHDEWERRRFRNAVHLTIGGCLGPCALANVALLLFDGQAQWFHSVNADGLVLALYEHVERMLETDGVLAPPPALADAIARMIALLGGSHDVDLQDVELDMRRVPELAQRIYAAARAIPPGYTATYGDIARQLGDPLLARDVGQALSRNPYPIIVPCHRVIGANGSLTGYGGGLERKQILLELERAAVTA